MYMKKFLLLAFSVFFALYMSAQDSWKVKLNNKVILAADKVDDNANTRKIKSGDWKKNGSLEVAYKGERPEAGWVRTFYFLDETGNEIIVKDNTSKANISLKTLRKSFAGKKKIDIYTIVRPTDPEVAMRVRIRRVHLCSLELP
jgi:hypothetical protein